MDIPKLYTTEEMAALFHVGRMTIHRWVKTGKLAPVRVERRLYFKEDDVADLLKNKKVYQCKKDHNFKKKGCES